MKNFETRARAQSVPQPGRGDSRAPFTYELRRWDEFGAFMEALLGYEETHLRENLQHLAFIPVYFTLKFCLEELISNTFKYGYAGVSRTPSICVSVQPGAQDIRAQVVDNAEPFNPLEDLPASAATPEEDVVLGVALVQRMSDEMEYERTAAGNKITLRQKLPK